MTFSDQIGCRFYCIRNEDGEYWSNEQGWLVPPNRDDEPIPYTIFVEREKSIFRLPIGGHWEKL